MNSSMQQFENDRDNKLTDLKNEGCEECGVDKNLSTIGGVKICSDCEDKFGRLINK